MREHGVQNESWGPFAEGKNNIFTDPSLARSAPHTASPSPRSSCAGSSSATSSSIPKSVRAERMRENIDVFDFELTDDEMARIAALDTGATLFFDHADPAMVELAQRARRVTLSWADGSSCYSRRPGLPEARR